ncbi:ThiF family adenylyltransferase, partial [Salmonella enterica subsp. enterica serovar Weltevreden]|nr:ThiF family adenylyltransferase [Salmonella enterica subsp. enterica serovar Weltevreden]
QSINGFRRKKLYSDRINLLLRKKRGFLNKKDIQRLDAQWIHGRDQNEGLKALQNAKVLVLGCGSLGSQVAMRLAQSGVGNIILIDHDILV